MSKSAKRIARLERRVARLQARLPKAADQAVRNVLDVRSATHAVGFATVYPTQDDD